MDELQNSLKQYEEQLSMVNRTLETVNDEQERESVICLQSDLQQLIQLTKENLDALQPKSAPTATIDSKTELDDEYALFQAVMAKSGAYEPDSQDKTDGTSGDKGQGKTKNKTGSQDTSDSSVTSDEDSGDQDIENDLSALLGMKCSVLYTHSWGGKPCLYNAMVSTIEPREDSVQFNDIRVRVLFTNPTHSEMLPCPYYLEGECKFSDEQCRYSHGTIVPLSDLKEAIKPDYASLKTGSRILMKLTPPKDADISLTKSTIEKYHLWHRAIVRHLDLENYKCRVTLEHGTNTGQKRKLNSEEYTGNIEDIFPLNNDDDSDSSDSLSDTDYPESKVKVADTSSDHKNLIIERSLENPNNTPIGEWERHTRGIGSKLMFAMGYVPGTGLGAASDGRVKPVEARVLPVGKSLDHCMAISEKNAVQDPLKVEQRLKKLQKKAEERNKRAYEREKDRERRNVFNFLNKTLGDKTAEEQEPETSFNVKESSSKDLNIEQFKITEEKKRIEREIIKLNSSLVKFPPGSTGHRSINLQIMQKNKEITNLLQKENKISKEQTHRKDKQKITIF